MFLKSKVEYQLKLNLNLLEAVAELDLLKPKSNPNLTENVGSLYNTVRVVVQYQKLADYAEKLIAHHYATPPCFSLVTMHCGLT